MADRDDEHPAARAEALAGVGTWSLDLETSRLTTNPAARRLLGWTRQDRPPCLEDFLQAVHPEDRSRVATYARRLIEHGEDYLIEHRVLMPQDRTMHVRASACADRDDSGRVRVLHGITMDVTDLRRSLEDTRRQRDRSKAVLDNLTEGYLLSADGVILEVNEAMCALTGFDPQQLVGAGPEYPFWSPDRAEEMLALRASLLDRGSGHGEFELVRRDGVRLTVAYSATCVPSADPLPLWILLLRDVTEERERSRGLERRAASDPLTGVLNSRAFREALRSAVRLASDERPLSLALLDLDHFKRINDVHGHAVGDEVLVTAVERLAGATAGLGTFARVGGEEFALLMPDTDVVAGRRIVRRAIEALRATGLPIVGRITASAGVAQLQGGMTDDELYRLADGLLYEAKDQGRDQVR